MEAPAGYSTIPDELKGVFIICKAAAVEKGGSDFDNGFLAVDDGTGDLNCLARVGIGNRSDLRFSLDNIANAEVGGTIQHAETVRKVDKLRRTPSIDLGKIALMIV